MAVIQSPFAGGDSSVPEWFAAQVWAGKEISCARQLQARGYDIFLPCYRERRLWSDRVKTVERPLFDGYVFCRMLGEASARIITTPGVLRIVNDGRQPLAIAAEEIEAIRKVIDAGLAAEPWPYVEVGQSVRISDGPLRDVRGFVLRINNHHRLVISVSLLQRAVAVEIDAMHVIPDATPGWPVRAAGAR